MPFTAEEVQIAGNYALEMYFKNNPVDQIHQSRPWVAELLKGKKSMGGGKENAVINVRYRYQSNFQWTRGSSELKYNKRNTTMKASYPWGSCFDGYSRSIDEMIQAGINIHPNGHGKNIQDAELVQLYNLMEEDAAVLKEGAIEKFDQAMLLDGTQNAEAVPGLDYLVSTTPASGTIAGITASNTWWQNNDNAATALTTTATTGTIGSGMETGWRDCHRYAKTVPNFIMAGRDFIEALSKWYKDSGFTQITFDGAKPREIDHATGEGSSTGLHYNGVEIKWNPVFEDLDTQYSPTIPWSKRCYFLNMRHLQLRPIEGHDMIQRKPRSTHMSEDFYYGWSWKGALTMNQRNAHWVGYIA
jgi:hypothetical protein